jgi:plastocyanin
LKARRLPTASLAGLVATLALASCGGGGDTSEACSSDAVRIAMRGQECVPEEATAKVGQEVCWTNESIYPHDVRASTGADFKSTLFDKPETFTAQVDAPGRVEYVCTIHLGMTGVLQITR